MVNAITIGSDNSSAQLSLSWQAVTMDDTLVTGYHLYRSSYDEDNYRQRYTYLQ